MPVPILRASGTPFSGTWQQIDGGWSLMEDRLGIEVTVDDPESWNIGKPPAGYRRTGADRRPARNHVDE